VEVREFADDFAGVVLLGLSDVFAKCARLFEGVEEAAVAQRHEQAGAGDAVLHRLPLLRREISSRGHDPLGP
jgi:hypothetical protein